MKFLYRSIDENGLTNDPSEVQRVRTFLEQARNDGWTARPRHPGVSPLENDAVLERSGYKIIIRVRDRRGTRLEPRSAFVARIQILGPDGLQIAVPETYSFEAIQAGMNRCNLCNTRTLTVRYADRGRCCTACLAQITTQDFPDPPDTDQSDQICPCGDPDCSRPWYHDRDETDG